MFILIISKSYFLKIKIKLDFLSITSYLFSLMLITLKPLLFNVCFMHHKHVLVNIPTYYIFQYTAISIVAHIYSRVPRKLFQFGLEVSLREVAIHLKYGLPKNMWYIVISVCNVINGTAFFQMERNLGELESAYSI